MLQTIISVANYKKPRSQHKEKWFLWLSLKRWEASISGSASSASAIATEKNRENLSFFFPDFSWLHLTLAERMAYRV
jgi:hypothetical protein